MTVKAQRVPVKPAVLEKLLCAASDEAHEQSQNPDTEDTEKSEDETSKDEKTMGWQPSETLHCGHSSSGNPGFHW